MQDPDRLNLPHQLHSRCDKINTEQINKVVNRLRSLVLCVAGMMLTNAASGQTTPVVKATSDVTTTLPTYDYVLAGGDRLRIVVFGSPTLGGDFAVNGAGFLALPLTGEVDVRGLTSAQLAERITRRLADGYLKEPRVTVEVLTTRPFYILGEINHPGEYPFANGLTMFGAVAQAGGYTYRAKTREIFVKHNGQAQEQRLRVTPQTMVTPGDVIRIKERWF